jgi:lysophospholipase L1-like esterase
MSDRLDWTVAPTLAWGAALLCAALLVLDGDLGAVTARLMRTGEADAVRVAGGPSFLPPEGAADREGAEQPSEIPVAGVAGSAPSPAGPKAKRPVEDVCIDGGAGACRRWAMDGFYAAIAGTEATRAAAPVRVTWYGDSVSATDLIPGRVRARLQEAYGDGGIGFVHAAQPHRFMASAAFTRTNTGKWLTYASSLVPIGDDLYGVGGSTAEATGPGNKVRIKARTPSGKLSRIEVYYLAQPRGGTAEIVVDGEVAATIDTAADAKAARFRAVEVADAEHIIEIRVAAGRVRLFGVALERARGVVVDNLALVSASAKTMLNNHTEHWQSQLAHRGSDLTVVMLGSNDSMWLSAGKRAMADYQAQYESMLAPIRAARPTASCLVVAPLDQAEEQGGKLVGRALIPMMVEAQRAAAHAQGCAFWDTFTWMGGRGSAVRWNRRGLLGADFHHLSNRGSELLADGLVDALVAGYGVYKAR